MKTSKIFACLMAIVMTISLLPAAAYADEPNKPTTLMVNGENIINAEGNTVVCGNGKAVYDSVSNTLTLENATIDNEYVNGSIYSNGDLTINLIGANTITLTGNTSYGIYLPIGRSLTITSSDGSGQLSVGGRILIFGDTTISNCTLTVTSNEVNDRLLDVENGNLNIINSTVVVKSLFAEDLSDFNPYYAIFAYGEINISDNSNVDVECTKLGMHAEESMRISNSKVKAACSGEYVVYYGIDSTDTILIEGNSDVLGIGGIDAKNGMTISPASGSMLDIKVGIMENGETGATRFEDSPYSSQITFDADAMSSLFGGKTYAHISEHTHVYDQQVMSDEYLASAASCTVPASYYYSCECGAAGTQTFSGTELAEHVISTNWTSNGIGHWHACANCDTMFDYTSHSLVFVVDVYATDSFNGYGHYECTVCGYESGRVTTYPAQTEPEVPETPSDPGDTVIVDEEEIEIEDPIEGGFAQTELVVLR